MRTIPIQLGTARGSRGGFSIIEATMAIVIVGGLLIASLNTVGASTAAQYLTADHGRGKLLAASLMAEIMQQAYVDPGVTPIFGREPLENTTIRVDADDVDDYSGLREAPPENKDGTKLPGVSAWELSVGVWLVDPTDPTRKMATDAGAKLIKVVAIHQGKVVAELWAVKTGKPSPTATPVTPDPDPIIVAPTKPKGGELELEL